MSLSPPEPFVPLHPQTGSAGARPDLRVTIVSQAQNALVFKPLSSSAAAPAAGHGHACEPRVTLQREGDRVSAIQIECGCGQAIELACVY